jgi:hypothetical protein
MRASDSVALIDYVPAEFANSSLDLPLNMMATVGNADITSVV